MPSTDNQLTRDLETLFVEGQELIRDHNLHVRQKRIKRSDEVGFNQTKSFNEFAVHNWYFPGHNEWWEKVETVFRKHRLNLKRLEIKVKGYDPNEKTSSLATIFLSAVEEIEAMITGKSSLRLYRILPNTSKTITYRGGRVDFGEEYHEFQDNNAKMLTDYFWEKRFQEKNGVEIKSGALITPQEVQGALSISRDALEAAIRAVNVSMRRKSIPLRFKSEYGMKRIYLRSDI